jgi:hypothetical protein
MKPTERNQRRRYVVNPAFQRHFLVSILGLETTVFAMGALLTALFDEIFFNAAVLNSVHFQTLVLWYFVAFVLCGGILSYLGLLYSNRISGPLYRITLTLRAIAASEIPEAIQFRGKDFHPEVAQAMNEALAALRSQRAVQAEAWKEQAQRFHALAEECTLEELAVELDALALTADERAAAML